MSTTTFLPSMVHGLMTELKSYFLNMKGNAILDTEVGEDFTSDFPLCVAEMNEAPDSARLPGNGITRLDWSFSLRVHAFEPNAYNGSDNGYSAGLLQIIDDLRVYFENENWQTDEMKSLLENYGLRITFTGITKAESLSTNEGECMGYRLNFETIAFDENTNHSDDIVPDTVSVSGEVVFHS